MSRQSLRFKIAFTAGPPFQTGMTDSEIFYQWNEALPGTCINAGLAATVLGIFNVTADFATVFLPLPLIWNLHMQRKWKFQLIGIFLLSVL